MVQILEGAELALEAEERVGRHRAQGLERHARAPLLIERLVDHAHAARAEGPQQLEPARADEVVSGQDAHDHRMIAVRRPACIA